MESIVPPEKADLGKYVLIGKLATGGMGEIFLARYRDPSSGELLAIKRILDHHLSKPEYINMFQSEARLASWLQHPNIIEIYELGELKRNHYIAMEYVHGKSIRDIVERLRSRRVQMSIAHVVELAIQLCDGLAYAHMATDNAGRHLRIIHRDINPHNLLVSYSGELKIIDFGIAKSEMSPTKTSTGTIKGKFVYMSPEQSAAEQIDHRSDIFSLGIVIYELLTLENPFARTNVVLSLEAIQRQAVVPPSDNRRSASALDAVLMKALHKVPGKRYQTATQMADALCLLRESEAVPRSNLSLGRFLHELFADDIEQEEQLLFQHWGRSLEQRSVSESIHAIPSSDKSWVIKTPTMRVRRLREPSAFNPSDDPESLRARLTSLSQNQAPEPRRLLPSFAQPPLWGPSEMKSHSLATNSAISNRKDDLQVGDDGAQQNRKYIPQPAAIVSPIYGHPGPVASGRSSLRQAVWVVAYVGLLMALAALGYVLTMAIIEYIRQSS